MGEFEFDVFLCHNSQDKPTVIEIANQLKAKTIKPWLDDWELQPGLPWQPELQRQIQNIKSAAVFIGQNGIGPWQQREIESFLQEFDQRKCPVIPVLLPQAPQKEPELPLFLKSMTWVDFREGSSVYTDPLEKLVWGITGIKPVSQSIIQHKAIKRHNYSNLEELLNARNWGEADNVTFTIICTILDVEKKQPLYIKDIKNFLCTDLLTIEKLWLKYSNNRFGFSKQHQIWDNLLSTQTKQQQQEDYAWKTFLNEVGWNGKFISEQNAPEGHFPAIGTWFTAYQPGWLETLFSRLDTCIQSQTIKPLELLNSHLDYPPNLTG
ncbi:GUN4 domain-containing protein [Dolichospermum sp. ST_sed1]|nr:GUN4 domain-containing protein [Dolichospermum sp. ST_sed1]MDD1428415.1 GUN4 domain-containing protein [Dolichospermum sp. ST_sed9]MDD1434479.1 GUN4 domain-containing protein [Dolichospermum sp. ST_sed6]MDD1443847.1 GUN4 domain-containing protein [Dolichospermum sp. ST_sed3]MDD1449411.1 GUN4 domain-containing protein [Dolichospermum sp. ST_sed8]MDD1458176.1 GUN4 domain-containing protein [Dolichospermum sp. ST_sed7]MDD1459165.1 GUN4 domain-containing protein [Dolichospermum sp. ST_sed2]MD